MTGTLPIIIERLNAEPIEVCAIFPGAVNVIPLGPIPGLPGPLAERIQAVTFVIDGGDAPISTGDKGELFIPYEFNIVGWTLIADGSCTFEVDIRRDTFAAFPPTAADSITGGFPPRLINQRIRQEDAAGWQTLVPAQSVLRYHVTNAIDAYRVTVALTVERQ